LLQIVSFDAGPRRINKYLNDRISWQYSNFFIPTKYWLDLFARRECWRRDGRVILCWWRSHPSYFGTSRDRGSARSSGPTGSHLPSTSRQDRAKIDPSKDNGSSIANIWPTRETRLLLAERLDASKCIFLDLRLIKSIDTFYKLTRRTVF